VLDTGSSHESVVSGEIFIPLHEQRQTRFRYGRSFLQFAVSVLWRSLIVRILDDDFGTLEEVSRDCQNSRTSVATLSAR